MNIFKRTADKILDSDRNILIRLFFLARTIYGIHLYMRFIIFLIVLIMDMGKPGSEKNGLGLLLYFIFIRIVFLDNTIYMIKGIAKFIKNDHIAYKERKERERNEKERMERLAKERKTTVDNSKPEFNLEEEVISGIKFVEDTKSQIKNKTKLNIFWPKSTNKSIMDRENFTAYINNSYKKTPFIVHMNKFGVYKVSFPTGLKEDIMFNQKKDKKVVNKNNIDTENGEIDLSNMPNNVKMSDSGILSKGSNYKELARKWFNNNFTKVNNLYASAINTEDGFASFVIEKDVLPTEKETLREIGHILTSQIKNANFYINNGNLKIKFKKEV